MPHTSYEKASILQILNLHSSDITCCDFDDDFRFVSGSSDKKVIVCDWKPNLGFVETSFSPITEYKYGVTGVKFIPQEQELITSSADGSISIFNAESGELLHVFMHTNLASIRTFCYVYECRYLLSAADDGSVCVFDLSRKFLKKSLQLHDETISVICVSHDSKMIVTGDTTGFVKLWYKASLCDAEGSVEPIPEHCIPDCHDLGINRADFSPVDNISDRGKEYKVVTCGNDNLLKVWKIICRKRNDVACKCTSELLFVMVGHGSAVTDVKFNTKGDTVVSTSLDKTTRLWAIDEFQYRCIKVLKGHERYVTACCFSPDGSLLATGSNDKSVAIWDLTGEGTLNAIRKKANHVQTSSIGSPLMKKDIPKILQKIKNLGNAVNTCALSKNNILAAGGTDKLVRLWHRNETTLRFHEISVSPLRAHQYAVNQVEFSSCCKYLASCSVDGTTVVWNLTEYNQVGAVHSVEGSIKCCKFSPDSRLLATGGDNETLYIWNVNNLQAKADMIGHTDSISCLSFTSDSKYLASGCLGGSLRLWCVMPCTTICLMCEENVHDLGLTSVDFCLVDSVTNLKDNRYKLATGGNDSLVKLWEIHVVDKLTAKAKEIFQLVGHGGDVTCVRFSPNASNLLASTSIDKTARIWDTRLGICLQVLDSKESMLTCCSFSFDGFSIVTGTLADRSIIVWDLRTSSNILSDDLLVDTKEIEDDDLKIVEQFRESHLHDEVELNIPDEFKCPITHQLMANPVTCHDGYNYEKSAILAWFSSGKLTSPMTNEPISVIELILNVELQREIIKFVKESKLDG